MTSCVSDFGYTAAGILHAKSIVVKATVDSAIQIAIALWERNSSQSIANMQDELADRQTKLAEEVFAHAKLFWPAEATLVNQVFSEGKAVTEYHTLADGWGQMADVETDVGRTNWIAQMAARCTPASQCEDARWQRNAQLVRADLMSYAARQDEARTQILNDRRYARQYAVLALGKGQLRDLMTYQSVGNSIGTNASEMLMATVNSALTTYGYYSNRMNITAWNASTPEPITARVPVSMEQAPMRLTREPAPAPLAPVSNELLKPVPVVKEVEPYLPPRNRGMDAYGGSY